MFSIFIYSTGIKDKLTPLINDLEKNNIDFLLNKGVVLMELGKFEEAVDSFNRVLLRSPDNEDAFFLKEECLEYL